MFNNLIYNATKKSHNFFQRCRTAINSCIHQNTIKSGSPCFDRSKKYLFFAKLQRVKVGSTFFIQQLSLKYDIRKIVHFDCIHLRQNLKYHHRNSLFPLPTWIWLLGIRSHVVGTTCALSTCRLENGTSTRMTELRAGQTHRNICSEDMLNHDFHAF